MSTTVIVGVEEIEINKEKRGAKEKEGSGSLESGD